MSIFLPPLAKLELSGIIMWRKWWFSNRKRFRRKKFYAEGCDKKIKPLVTAKDYSVLNIQICSNKQVLLGFLNYQDSHVRNIFNDWWTASSSAIGKLSMEAFMKEIKRVTLWKIELKYEDLVVLLKFGCLNGTKIPTDTKNWFFFSSNENRMAEMFRGEQRQVASTKHESILATLVEILGQSGLWRSDRIDFI